MMTREENERLTRVGPGTPAGAMLRRYWLPIAVSSQVGKAPVERRLLGEDLVVFRTTEGQVAVVDRRCAHRRTSLAIGTTEAKGIRCGYHGWVYDLQGQCIEQPAEPRLNPNIRIKAYPAEELGGLIFAYLGPQPAPLLPRYDILCDSASRDIGSVMLDLNWLQAMENSVDPHHVEWLHGKFAHDRPEAEEGGNVGYHAQRHLKVAFDPFPYGIVKRRLLEGQTEEADDWKIGHPLVFPYMLKWGVGGMSQLQIRVPIDDVTTWHIWYTVYGMPNAPRFEDIPCYEVPLVDEAGKRRLDFIDAQDISAWIEQGRIADRSEEHLGASDVGVVAFRRMLSEQIDRVARGEDPIGVVRDARINQCIVLPVEQKKFSHGNGFLLSMLRQQAIRFSPLRGDMVAFLESEDAQAESTRSSDHALSS